MPPLKPHTHNGVDSQKIDLRHAKGLPKDALTAEDDTALSSGGALDLKTSDSDVIDNIRTRLGELESRLQALGVIN